MSFSPNLGRWLQEDPERSKAGDTNLYRYEGNGPISRTDPDGLEWIVPGHHEIGYTVPPKESPKDEPNCMGAAMGIPRKLGCSEFADKKFVPSGCREVTGYGITKPVSPCRRGETELIVAWVVDKKSKEITCHAIGRHWGSLVLTWTSKLGDVITGGFPPGKPESIVGSGNYVHGITNWQAHFEWYFGEWGYKPDEIHYRAFCCDKSNLNVVGENLK